MTAIQTAGSTSASAIGIALQDAYDRSGGKIDDTTISIISSMKPGDIPRFNPLAESETLTPI